MNVYPVDTVIPQLSPAASRKQELHESSFLPISGKAAPGSELDNLFGTDADLSSILFNPPSKESATDLGISSDFSSLFDLFSDAAAPGLAEAAPFHSTSSEIPSTSTFWDQPSKLPLQDSTKLGPSSEPSTSDPLFSELYRDGNAALSPESLPPNPHFDDFLYDSPPGSLQASPGAMGGGLGDQLQELLMKTTIDFPDAEFMFPSPAKKLHGGIPSLTLPPPSHSLTPQPSPSHSLTPQPSPSQLAEVKHEAPTSPSFLSPAPSPAPSEHKATPPPSPPLPSTSWEKTRGPLLFGKHEDEIIHKLVVSGPGAFARPVARDKFISMPVEEFNQMLEQSKLSDIEVAFMKEWRRRGKNKTAAQVARKRKREELSGLDGEVAELHRQKAELQLKFDRLRSEIATLRERTVTAEEVIYRQYRTQRGAAVSRDSHTIHVSADDRVMLVPRTSSQVLVLK